MKTYFLSMAILVVMTASAQLRIPAQSPSASIKQTIGLTDIEIDYSRPSTKGRTIFGEQGLLPYGEFWRVGANTALKITFSEDIEVDGQPLKKGSYTLLSIPGAKTWEIKWYPYENTNWNSYVAKEPVLNLNVPVYKSNSHLETLEFRFQDLTLDSATLLLEWEQISLQIPLKVQEKERILKAIEKTIIGPSSSDYFQAAVYLHDTKTDLDKALEYIQKVTLSDKALFFQVTREALILKELNQNKEAFVVANRALLLSKEAGNKDFIRLNQKLIKELSL
ncbi:DUF2911 domain-containing protein [Dokdonia ponticola]|uniref:DUF2911 domain-containing protein n=1 Tax=Dokdonia ponticola TaxID=2041041 RepID=A0ABV9I1L4_9FLAO